MHMVEIHWIYSPNLVLMTNAVKLDVHHDVHYSQICIKFGAITFDLHKHPPGCLHFSFKINMVWTFVFLDTILVDSIGMAWNAVTMGFKGNPHTLDYGSPVYTKRGALQNDSW